MNRHPRNQTHVLQGLWEKSAVTDRRPIGPDPMSDFFGGNKIPNLFPYTFTGKHFGKLVNLEIQIMARNGFSVEAFRSFGHSCAECWGCVYKHSYCGPCRYVSLRLLSAL